MKRNYTTQSEDYDDKYYKTTESKKVELHQKRPAVVSSLKIGPPARKKQRRGLVTRTHSPRSKSSTPPFSLYNRILKSSSPKTQPDRFRLEVKNICPTLRGVTEAARLLKEENVVVIPTESVYMACTSFCPFKKTSSTQKSTLQLLNLLSSSSENNNQNEIHNNNLPVIIITSLKQQQQLSMLDHLVDFMIQKPYAILQKDGKSTSPVVFSESQEIFRRLGEKFWPGPLRIYLRTQKKCDNNNFLQTFIKKQPTTKEDNKSYYIAISNPSHPLTNRVVKEVSSSNRIIVAFPSLSRQQGTEIYNTKALDVCSHHSSQFFPEMHSIYVLNGEEKRELFSVPTCQFGSKPLLKGSSLWIDASSRIVYIRGSKKTDGNSSDNESAADDTLLLSENNVIRAIRWCYPTTTTHRTFSSIAGDNDNNERRQNNNKNRCRVITAVLCKWRVIDERS